MKKLSAIIAAAIMTFSVCPSAAADVIIEPWDTGTTRETDEDGFFVDSSAVQHPDITKPAILAAAVMALTSAVIFIRSNKKIKR